MPIKITSSDAKKGLTYPQIRDSKAWSEILKVHFINIVEDTFVLYHNTDRMTPELKKKWEYFKSILKERL